MTTAEVIPFPEPSFEDKYCIYPRTPKGGGETYFISAAAYAWDQGDLLHEVARPFHGGWVASVEACFHRRTKEEYIKMFQLNEGDVDFGLMGFRDVQEALLCEAAAIEVGSKWRYLDYLRRQREYGSYDLGSLNEALSEYKRCYIPDLFPYTFPAPSND